MKIIKYIFSFSLVALLAVSCEKGLDPIESVSPKPDVSAPTVSISFPVEGKPFVSPDEIATITFKAIAEDDVELKSVTLELDGVQIDQITEFKDYRRLDLKYNYSQMTDGNHTFTVTVYDLTDKNATASVNFSKITAPVYEPLDGEVLYLPLDGFYLDLISGNEVSVTGSPGFATGKVNDCYAGAADAYMTYPVTGMLGTEFSVCFWYKINPDPQRGGILAISPEGDDRSFGLRMFHENSGALQNIGLNFGDGTAEVWMNPFVQVDPASDWIHIAISISTTNATIYVNGEIAPMNSEVETTGVDWTGCNGITIASGMPNFVYWEHFSDNSLYDEFHLFTRAITADEVLSFYQVKK